MGYLKFSFNKKLSLFYFDFIKKKYYKNIHNKKLSQN